MSPEIEKRLLALEWDVWHALDMLHDQFLKQLDRMARSTGQRTRVDRVVK